MTPEQLKQAFDDLNKAVKEMRDDNDRRLKQIEAKGHADPLLEEKVNKANAEISRLEAEIKAGKQALESVQTALNRAGSSGGEGGADEAKARLERTARKAALQTYFAKGVDHMTMEQKKLMASDDQYGGYFVMPEMEKEILRTLATINAVRGLARVRTLTKGDAFERRKRTAGVTMTWVNETGSVPAAQTPTVGKLRIPAEQGMVKIVETSIILEDSDFDIENWLQEEAVEAFANGEGVAFLTGSGIGKPRGMLDYANGTSDGQVEQVNSGSAATIGTTGDAFITLAHKLKAAYAKNATWLLNRLTVASIRKLKDSQNNYLWQPALGSDNPATICGRPYEEDDNMPVEGAGNLVAVLADFKKFYTIVDRLGLSVIRDPFSAKPDIEFLFRKRVGGAVELFEAGKILKCSA